jgi:3-phenylpropionate/cinnamic acid dioxygenase small subunit
VTSELSAREVSDRIQIQDVLMGYAQAVDERDWDALAAAFTSDAMLDYTAFGGPRGSVQDAVEWLMRALAVIAASQHLLSNIRVRVDGDEATATAEVFSPLAIDRPDGGRTIMLTGGSYVDRLRRTDDGWRIAERTARLTWSDRPVRAPR